MFKVAILDGYIDEPTCLGVPPYISPYPRYIAGAIWNYNPNSRIQYFTIDQIRNNKKHLETLNHVDVNIAIAGMSVPGRYLSGYPASYKEILNIYKNISRSLKILCGPAAKHGFGISGGRKTRENNLVKNVFDLIVKGDAEVVISKLLQNNLNPLKVNPDLHRKKPGEIRDYAVKGSRIVSQHPFYPHYLISEIETYRGCPRSIVGGCSFCSEPQKGPPSFRPIRDIVDEIQSLYQANVKHFRLGNQPCIFSYMAKNADRKEYPTPNPDALEKLFRGIRRVAPGLKTLHVDNANPGVIARYPQECKDIGKTIINYHTPGDVAAFGVESVDPNVIQKNNLKANPEQVEQAIKILNQIGAKRGYNGMPELLPGLNFVFGLKGETKKTYQFNYQFLKNIVDQNLLVRRINLRQVIPLPHTSMYNVGVKIINKNKKWFKQFKRKVKKNIEQPLLKKLLPMETVLKKVYTEKHRGKLTLGRQIGSFPLLIGIPGVLPLHKFYDVKVIDYGYRSITALPYPLDINQAKRETIQAIPGIGKKRTIRILANRPFANQKQLLQTLDSPETLEKIQPFINISKN